ncbi:MAG: M1 family aminopeptidase, partial [Pyrinomonadaceae bacterium]
MEAVFREQAFGRGDYLRKIRSDAAEFLVDDAINRRRHALYNLRAGDVNSLFDNSATTYHKGGVVIHMLREHVGTEKFWKGVNIYLDRHKFDSVESTDLKKALEEASGQDLGWFFDQWVYGAGAPKLDFKPSYNARTKTLNITVFQTQTVDGITPTAFRLPLDMVIKTAAGDVRHDIELKKRVQTFSIKLAGKPTSLVIDENEKIPLKEVKIRPITTLK